jgi:phosphoglycolate phosphatase
LVRDGKEGEIAARPFSLEMKVAGNESMDGTKTILFDFDGTIAATVQEGVVIFNGLAQKYGFAEITPENADELRAKSPRAVMKELGIPMLKVPTVVRSLRNGIRSVIPGVQCVEGVRVAILALREGGYRLGIVTSNSIENVRQFLKNNDMEIFDYLQAGAGVFSKASSIKKLMVRESLKKDETIFVGDEIRDIEAARKNGMKVVAVTWGINSREGLAGAEPNFIVDTAEELMEVLL